MIIKEFDHWYVDCDTYGCDYEEELGDFLTRDEAQEELENCGWYIDGETTFCPSCVAKLDKQG